MYRETAVHPNVPKLRQDFPLTSNNSLLFFLRAAQATIKISSRC